jgi:hypothetical protein
MSAIPYKGYLIEPYETHDGKWRARVTRVDGQVIRTYPDNRESPFIPTRECRSKDEAIEAGKDLVDNIEKGLEEMKA